jgi:hypothetical protein
MLGGDRRSSGSKWRPRYRGELQVRWAGPLCVAILFIGMSPASGVQKARAKNKKIAPKQQCSPSVTVSVNQEQINGNPIGSLVALCGSTINVFASTVTPISRQHRTLRAGMPFADPAIDPLATALPRSIHEANNDNPEWIPRLVWGDSQSECKKEELTDHALYLICAISLRFAAQNSFPRIRDAGKVYSTGSEATVSGVERTYATDQRDGNLLVRLSGVPGQKSCIRVYQEFTENKLPVTTKTSDAYCVQFDTNGSVTDAARFF